MARSTPPPELRDDVGLPRWVKFVGIAAVIAIALLVALVLAHGVGGHRPPQHFGTGTQVALPAGTLAAQ
jgi:hypothetical protein